MPVGQSGATEPCWWMDKMVKVMTPATEVTNVEARAAGATSAGRLPEPIRMGARIDPVPLENRILALTGLSPVFRLLARIR